jgi:hypothetical protein
MDKVAVDVSDVRHSRFLVLLKAEPELSAVLWSPVWWGDPHDLEEIQLRRQ